MSSQSFSDLTASASPTNFKVPPLLMKTCGYWPRRFESANISERRALLFTSTPSISSTSIFLPRKIFRRLAWAPSTMVVDGMLVTRSSTASAVAASSDIVTAEISGKCLMRRAGMLSADAKKTAVGLQDIFRAREQAVRKSLKKSGL